MFIYTAPTSTRLEGRNSGSYHSTSYETEDDLNPEDFEIDVIKEKRTQKYLVFAVTVYAICLCPIMIMRLIRLVVMETYENTLHLDITYTAFVWLAFVPTCTNPLIYTAWQMSRSSKDRLKGYFRFSDRRLRRSCETVATNTGTPLAIRKGCKVVDKTSSGRVSADSSILMDVESG